MQHFPVKVCKHTIQYWPLLLGQTAEEPHIHTPYTYTHLQHPNKGLQRSANQVSDNSIQTIPKC